VGIRHQVSVAKAIAQQLWIDPTAVIFDFDVQGGAAPLDLELDQTGLALAQRLAFFLGLHAVIDTVAEQVHEGVSNDVEDDLVGFGVHSDQLEAELFFAVA